MAARPPPSPVPLTLVSAAACLGVDVAHVRWFVHQRLLRPVTHDPLTVPAADVARLQRVLARRPS